MEPEASMDAPATATANGNGADDKYAAESFPDRFPSWEALDAYVQEFKEHSYQMFGVRTSVPVKRRNERIAQRHSTDSAYQKLPELWQFYSRIYGCTHGVRPRNRGKGLRVHGSVRDTGCTARMNATLKVDRVTKLYYISVRLDGFHNHPCDKERYYGYPENRRIKDPALLCKLLQMHERGMSFGEIQRRLAKLIVETRGNGLTSLFRGEGGVPTRADLHNTISRLKAAKQAETGSTSEPQTHVRSEGDDEEPYKEHEHDNVDDVKALAENEKQTSSPLLMTIWKGL
uniref:FAR1 domain-containing protein n=1 Tax=Globisporangium ultimum (strain ATCC 200006 / CBS 805.95 / DAOM BR144) TaxID=431595 RepID=K3WY64_GLOUD